MAKISFVLLVVALIASLHVSEAHRSIKIDEQALEKDLHEARDLIDQDLKEKEKKLENDLHEAAAKDSIDEDLIKEKEMNIKNLENEVNMLTQSEVMLIQLGDAYKTGRDLKPFGKKLKKFNRRVKQAPKEVSSIIQAILKDLGLNGGRVV